MLAESTIAVSESVRSLMPIISTLENHSPVSPILRNAIVGGVLGIAGKAIYDLGWKKLLLDEAPYLFKNFFSVLKDYTYVGIVASAACIISEPVLYTLSQYAGKYLFKTY